MTHGDRVLVVDDDPEIRDALSEVLRAEGYDATAASNGSEALDALSGAGPHPAAIVLDLMMPVMTGWEFLERKERDPLLSAIPVIVVSASGRGPHSGAAFHLDKPFDLETFLHAVRRCTRSHPPRAPTSTGGRP